MFGIFCFFYCRFFSRLGDSFQIDWFDIFLFCQVFELFEQLVFFHFLWMFCINLLLWFLLCLVRCDCLWIIHRCMEIWNKFVLRDYFLYIIFYCLDLILVCCWIDCWNFPHSYVSIGFGLICLIRCSFFTIFV